jgi:DNA-binding HxlR family transcriptional regulator
LEADVTITELPAGETVGSMCHSHMGAAEMIRDIFAKICDKWSMLILGMLDGAPHRFTALRDNVPGISHRMLTLTLRNLERDGLVRREVFAEVPPRVEYSVTELGTTIMPAAKALAFWALENATVIRANRDGYDDRMDALS